ncbi:helix-turn-helix domain-containing protein [Paenibacillus chitinolyticus]|uniref:helix-turn-helix domain-containing protein n=1 Tax=Paenibacillus chitinolyticus TaxID=79263 RepID=UPI0036DA1174
MNKYLNVKEVSILLGITSSSIYNLIDHPDPNKKLEPVNRETYKGDGGYRFKHEDVEKIKPIYLKHDLTTSKAAEQLGKSKSFLQKLMRSGAIPYYEDTYHGQRTFLFVRKSSFNTKIVYRQQNSMTLSTIRTGMFFCFNPLKEMEKSPGLLK